MVKILAILAILVSTMISSMALPNGIKEMKPKEKANRIIEIDNLHSSSFFKKKKLDDE